MIRGGGGGGVKSWRRQALFQGTHCFCPTPTLGGSMVGSDRLNVPAIDNSSHYEVQSMHVSPSWLGCSTM